MNIVNLVVCGVIALSVIIVLLNSFVVVKGDEVVVLERRWFGNKIKDGRIFALSDEVGIQVRNLMPGFHVLVPFLYKYYKAKITNIKEDEIGIVESLDGKAIPNNRIFGCKVSGHENYQSGETFLKNGGEKGVQIEVLPPGDYRVNPLLFNIQLVKMVVIERGEVGIIYSQDGLPLREGQLFADSINGHNDYQNIEEFLKNGGQKGPQINVLKPGQYKINTSFFKVKKVAATNVPHDKIGLVTANAGVALPKNEIVAISIPNHNSFQDGQAFLDNGGQKGRQNEYLSSGLYYLNTDLFSVEQIKQFEVMTGYVGVLTSFIGVEPSQEIETALSGSQVSTNSATSEEVMSETAIMPENYKGIQHKILRPGLYPINTYAYSAQLIDITNISIEWENNSSSKSQFNPLQVLSKDGFQLTVAVKVIVRVKPQQAPLLVAKVGGIEKLIKDVVDPIISSSFRNQASKASAISFLQDRSLEQENSEQHVREELAKYNVECVSVLITNIEIPQDLMQTQTKKIIAEQEIAQLQMQQKSAEEKVKTEKTLAIASQQPELVRSEIAVQVANQNKLARIADAEGEKQSQILSGEGEAGRIIAVADANAHQINQIGQANAEAYEKQVAAMGKEGIINLETLKLLPNIIRDGMKLVPDIVVSGEGGNAQSAFWTSLAKSLPGLKHLKIDDIVKTISKDVKEEN